MEANSVVIDRYKPRGATRLVRALGASIRGLRGGIPRRSGLPSGTCVRPARHTLGPVAEGHSGIERALLIAPMLLILVVELINSAIEATWTVLGRAACLGGARQG